jgi:hypothetical protein
MNPSWTGWPPNPEITAWHWLLPLGQKSPLPLQWLHACQQWKDANQLMDVDQVTVKYQYVEPVYFALVRESYTHYNIDPLPPG